MRKFLMEEKNELSNKTYNLNCLLTSSELKFNKFRKEHLFFSIHKKNKTTHYLRNCKTASSES